MTTICRGWLIDPKVAMRTVLLAGGLGTRLRVETEDRPKPMVGVGGRPVFWHIMKNFSAHGLNEFIVCTGYRGDVIKDYILNYEARNNDFTVDLDSSNKIAYHGQHSEGSWKVTVADTGVETMTSRRAKRGERYTADERFAVTYGDCLADVDVQTLLRVS
jgi:glucose-1-phosphate cytidylyltransferase